MSHAKKKVQLFELFFLTGSFLSDIFKKKINSLSLFSESSFL